MPLVILKRDPAKIPDGVVKDLGRWLPYLVSQALRMKDRPEIGLYPADIEIEVKDVGIHDVNAKPLAITIFANHYPERAVNIQESAEKIAKRLYHLHLLPDDVNVHECSVWIFLGQAGYAQIRQVQQDSSHVDHKHMYRSEMGYSRIRTWRNSGLEENNLAAINPEVQDRVDRLLGSMIQRRK